MPESWMLNSASDSGSIGESTICRHQAPSSLLCAAKATHRVLSLGWLHGQNLHWRLIYPICVRRKRGAYLADAVLPPSFAQGEPCRRGVRHNVPPDGFECRPRKHPTAVDICDHLVCDYDCAAELVGQPLQVTQKFAKQLLAASEFASSDEFRAEQGSCAVDNYQGEPSRGIRIGRQGNTKHSGQGIHGAAAACIRTAKHSDTGLSTDLPCKTSTDFLPSSTPPARGVLAAVRYCSNGHMRHCRAHLVG